MIRFDRFGWRFSGSKSWALHDVTLHIKRGEFVTIAGPSGSGKSTLALALCGLLEGRQAGEAAGTVCVNGQDVAAVPLHQVAQTVALVQQNPETHFATLGVRDEIAFGMENRCLGKDEIHRRSAEAMELLSIPHLRSRDLSTLSGGEKQRVAVASIIASGPEALVLDEPTASLDPEASRDLFQALADLCRRAGLTVVIIEHKLAHLLPLKPRLISLEGGALRADLAPGTAGAWDPAGPVRAPGYESPVRSLCLSGDPLVDMSGVTVEAAGHAVLDDISLEVRPGEVVGVLGPNGSGKSTLLNTLVGLVRPTRGSIRVCGVDVSKTRISDLAGRIGLVFQNADHQLVAETVWREALFAARNFKVLSAEVSKAAGSLLQRAGLSERKEDHPYRLSWGQKRRLNVISAILHGPPMLLLDEPFSGQDWDNATFLLEVLFGVQSTVQAADAEAEWRSRDGPAPCGPQACLLVTHDSRIVQRVCTRVLFLAEGRIIVDSSVREGFDRLADMGHEAYVPADWQQVTGAAAAAGLRSSGGVARGQG